MLLLLTTRCLMLLILLRHQPVQQLRVQSHEHFVDAVIGVRQGISATRRYVWISTTTSTTMRIRGTARVITKTIVGEHTADAVVQQTAMQSSARVSVVERDKVKEWREKEREKEKTKTR